MKKIELTHMRLLEVLHYEPLTGVFTWKSRNTMLLSRFGSIAGTVHKSGYRQIQIDGVIHKEHRLAWFFVHAEWPEKHIDHINGERASNQLSNLRQADSKMNGENRRSAQCNNKTGLLGVSPSGRRFVATIKTQGPLRHIGSFETAEAAHAAYLAVKRVKHEGCTI